MCQAIDDTKIGYLFVSTSNHFDRLGACRHCATGIAVWFRLGYTTFVWEAPEMGFYEDIAVRRGDSAELQACIGDTIAKRRHQETSSSKPGILLGKIQSGKTR